MLPEALRVEAQADGAERYVVGAVVYHRGAVLIVRRNDLVEFLPGIKELPSGGVEAGETLAEALDRELLEEVGFGAGEIDDDFLEEFDYVSASGRLTRQFTVSLPWADRPEVEIDGDRTKVLAEQVSAVDPNRLGERSGHLAFGELRAVDAALRLVMSLGVSASRGSAK